MKNTNGALEKMMLGQALFGVSFWHQFSAKSTFLFLWPANHISHDWHVDGKRHLGQCYKTFTTVIYEWSSVG